MAKYAVNKKIMDLLKNNPRYSYNAPTIYKHFKGRYKLNTIRSELRRLHEKKLILRETHGFYKIAIDADALYYLERPPTLLHGIMVSMEWIRKVQKDIHGITSNNYILDIQNRLYNIGFIKCEGRNKQRVYRCFKYQNDNDRLITITVHFNGRLDVYVNCSKKPINYFEFRDILNYSQGVVDFLGPFKEQRVVQFGMAKDFREIRLDNNCLTLRAFMDSWFRVYNKEVSGLDVTRVEQHLRCNVSIDSFFSMFERMFLPVGNGVIHKEDERIDVV